MLADTTIDLFSISPEMVSAAAPLPIIPGVVPGCFHLDVSASEYHGLTDSVSCTGLKQILRSPAHFQDYLRRPGDDKPNLGTALHAAALEQEFFLDTYRVYEERRGTKAYDAFVAENPGKIILNKTEWLKVYGMVRAMMEHEDFPLWQMLQTCQREMSIFWTDEETGIQCRVRLDSFLPGQMIFDLKTTNDARPHAFLRQAIDMDYDLQAAMYTEAVRRYTGKTLPFVFVAVEDDSPHGIWLHPADQSVLDNGWKKFRRALSIYRQCLDTGKWPKYTNAYTPMSLPRYALLKD